MLSFLFRSKDFEWALRTIWQTASFFHTKEMFAVEFNPENMKSYENRFLADDLISPVIS